MKSKWLALLLILAGCAATVRAPPDGKMVGYGLAQCMLVWQAWRGDGGGVDIILEGLEACKQALREKLREESKPEPEWDGKSSWNELEEKEA